MLVKMLVGARKCRYEGEYGYEVMAAVDEYTDSDNPAWFINQCAKERAKWGDELDADAVVQVMIPDDELKKVLYPSAVFQAQVLT